MPFATNHLVCWFRGAASRLKNKKKKYTKCVLYYNLYADEYELIYGTLAPFAYYIFIFD